MNNKDIIDHIAVQVDDVKKSISWYTKKFRCKTIYVDDTWGFIEFENIKLAFVKKNEHPPHFAVIDQNIILNKDTVKHRDGSVSKYIQDLDNNKIELIKYEKDNS